MDIGIDLGTANTVIYIRDSGIVLREPSVVAVDKRNDSVLAVGNEAKEMTGRTPDAVRVLRPLKDGVITDIDITTAMINRFVKSIVKKSVFSRPRMVICVPSGCTEIEKNAIDEVADNAGARYVEIMEEPVAAAIGADLAVNEPVGTMVVDIGGGTCEAAVISMGDIVTSCSVRVAGDEFDEAIMHYVRKKYDLLIGNETAEKIKIQIGSACQYEKEGSMNIKGRDQSTGLPKSAKISSAEVREALQEPLAVIVDTVRTTLEKTPPELSADIFDNGIMLTGGGALLRGINKLIAKETGMIVHVADSPLDCVALGSGKRIETMYSPSKKQMKK